MERSARRCANSLGSRAIRPIDGSVERDLGGRHLFRRPDLLRGLLEETGDLVFCGVALEDLGQDRIGAGETNKL